MAENLRQGFKLGDCEVHPPSGTIRTTDGSRHVAPSAMDVLVCLAERPGRLVTRDELIKRVWKGNATGEHALTRCIADLRHQLDDHPENPVYIQTLPRRGYRLLAPVNGGRSQTSPTPRDSKDPLRALWENLKERNVVRVAVAYAAVSWLLLQVAQVIGEALQFPDWWLRAFVVLLGVGFLLATIVAWLFQVVPEKENEESTRQLRLNRFVDFAIIAVLAIAVTFLVYRQFIDEPLFPTVAELPSIMTSPAPSRFSNGLGEHLLNLLARIEGLLVPSRTVTWMMSDRNLDPRRISQDLRVRYVLEGSVQQQADQIRVTAQLIDGVSGNHVWSETYDASLTADNFFNLQDTIARRVVDRLELTLSDEVQAEMASRQTVSNEAFDLYLIGREELGNPKERGSLERAVAAFQASIEIDPHFAKAHAGLCEAQLRWYVIARDTSYFDAAESACIRALRINKNLGEVYAALGSLHRYAGQYEEAANELLEARALLHDPAYVLEELGRTYRALNQLVQAEETFRLAIDKEPGSWSVYKSMGNFLFRTGRYADALPYYKQVILMQDDSASAFNNIGAAFFMLSDFDNATVAWRRSLDLESTDKAWMNYGNSLYYQGRFSDSVEAYRQAVALNDSDFRTWGSLATSCRFAEDEENCAFDAYARSIDLIGELLAINPLDASALSEQAAHFARSGDPEAARDSLQKLDDIQWDDPNVAFFSAIAYLALGEPDAALEQLNTAVIMGYPSFLISADPEFEGLADNPNFRELLRNRLE
jgi:TolB-like protein/DNA-binding winged helix-turn-helix (wHTH) protein/Flp pilus assembly protein TadD